MGSVSTARFLASRARTLSRCEANVRLSILDTFFLLTLFWPQFYQQLTKFERRNRKHSLISKKTMVDGTSVNESSMHTSKLNIKTKIRLFPIVLLFYQSQPISDSQLWRTITIDCFPRRCRLNELLLMMIHIEAKGGSIILIHFEWSTHHLDSLQSEASSIWTSTSVCRRDFVSESNPWLWHVSNDIDDIYFLSATDLIVDETK